MISIRIDNFKYYVKSNISILEACKLAGIHIPRFCYHELLSVSGNCRMCLVEIEEAEKPVASCVTEIADNMSIFTNSPFVKKARENVVETLLINHPLDCPICDQAGECDLQDQAKKFGGVSSRIFFNKKTVENKYCGPLIKTVMTRCITCTRCVRFGSEIAGIEFFGTLNRGVNTEIGSYIPNFFNSEISGNVIELCPVGALTSAPYASKARPWELRITETIDVSDSLNSNIYVNYKETNVLRVTPKTKTDINSSLISDRARFSYDANSINRLISVKGINKNNKLNKKHTNLGWKKFLQQYDDFHRHESINFFIDESLDFESLCLLNKLKLQNPKKFNITSSATNKNGNYYINPNTHINDIIEKCNASILFLGTNPKIENAILNAKIRIKSKNNIINIIGLGLFFNYNFFCNFINLNLKQIAQTIDGKTKTLNENVRINSSSIVFLGESLKDKVSNISYLKSYISKNLKNVDVIFFGLKANSELFNLFNIKNSIKRSGVNFFVKTADNVHTRKALHKIKDKNISILYTTHESEEQSKLFNYLLPASSHFEEESVYLNLENRPQKSNKVLEISKGCKSFGKTVRAFGILKENDQMLTKSFQYINSLTTINSQFDSFRNIVKNFKTEASSLNTTFKIKIKKYPLSQKTKNFYSVDTYTRNSQIMRKCSIELLNNFSNFIQN